MGMGNRSTLHRVLALGWANAALLLAASCSYTQIEEVNVQSNVGAGCSLARGKAVTATGEADVDANLLQQAGVGTGAGSLEELLSSNADCTKAVEGETAETADGTGGATTEN